MKYKNLTLSSNRKIHIFDDVFPYIDREYFFEFMTNSYFKFDGVSLDKKFKLNYTAKQYLQSFYTQKDVDDLKFLTHPNSQGFLKILKDCTCQRAYVYTSDHTTQHSYHRDPENYTLLYYPNIEWDNSYGGETMFASDDLSEIVFCSMYVPGRIIIFDAEIPHKMSAPSSSCPFNRFTFVMNWKLN